MNISPFNFLRSFLRCLIMTLELFSATIVIVAWGFHIIMIYLFGSPTFVIKSKHYFLLFVLISLCMFIFEACMIHLEFLNTYILLFIMLLMSGCKSNLVDTHLILMELQLTVL